MTRRSNRQPPPGVVRLIDASLNRASEGARVVEDYARFVLDDAGLSRRAKELRHGLAAAGSVLPFATRLALRDTPGDVGTAISTPTETARGGPWDVCVASLARLQEALRSLEEYGKTVDPTVGARFERLRYDAYILASALGAATRSAERLAAARLYVLVDCRESESAFDSLVELITAAGADIVQLRDKRAGDRTLVRRARRLAAICREHEAVSIVNDRADIAVAAGADGVHVGQEELSVADARRVVGAEGLVGVSTHSLDQVRSAVAAGADYLGVGPTFPSTTKAFEAFPGLDFVRRVAEEIKLPAFAIGGIDAGNVEQVVIAGLSRIAVGAAITTAADPAAATAELKRSLNGRVGTGSSTS